MDARDILRPCLEGDQTKIFTPPAASIRYDAAPQMDLESLTRLFATTLSPDPNVRKAGELQIRQVGRRLNVRRVDNLNQASLDCWPGGYHSCSPANNIDRGRRRVRV